MAPSAQPGTGPTEEFRFPGNRLGLPADGPGSASGWGRRVLALFVDWLIAGLVASAITSKPMWAGGNDYNTSHLVTFFAMTAILTGLLGYTIGHRICGIRVAPVRGTTTQAPGTTTRTAPGTTTRTAPGTTTRTAPPGLIAGLIRAFLLCLLIPAVVYDRDRRGLHDRAASTVVVRR